MWFLTLFKCVLLNIEPNVVRFLLLAGAHLHRKNIVKRFAQLRMMSDIRYDVIIYFARGNCELIFYVI